MQHTGAARALVERKLSDGLAITVRQRAAAQRPQTTEHDSASSIASIEGDAQRVVIDRNSLERIARAVVWSSLAERSYFQIETNPDLVCCSGSGVPDKEHTTTKKSMHTPL